MTKQQVRRTVAGYLDATSDEAFERMFERDKDTLRELGVPVRTVVSAGHGDDVGYRIDLEDYALAPFELTPAVMWGQFTIPAAYRTSLRGLVESSFPIFWNVEKA